MWWESCGEQLYGTIEWTIVWKNWMTNLVKKFYGIFLEQSGAQIWCKMC